MAIWINRQPEATRNAIINWRGEWDAGDRYERGDVVEHYRAGFMCLIAHTGVTPPRPEQANDYWIGVSRSTLGNPDPFRELPDAASFIAPWSATARYKVGDVVEQWGRHYVSLLPSHAAIPVHSEPAGRWGVITKYRGEWREGTIYWRGEIVQRNGARYFATDDNIAIHVPSRGASAIWVVMDDRPIVLGRNPYTEEEQRGMTWELDGIQGPVGQWWQWCDKCGGGHVREYDTPCQLCAPDGADDAPVLNAAEWRGDWSGPARKDLDAHLAWAAAEEMVVPVHLVERVQVYLIAMLNSVPVDARPKQFFDGADATIADVRAAYEAHRAKAPVPELRGDCRLTQEKR